MRGKDTHPYETRSSIRNQTGTVDQPSKLPKTSLSFENHGVCQSDSQLGPNSIPFLATFPLAFNILLASSNPGLLIAFPFPFGGLQ
jgi:hypothetical protein